MTPIAETPTGPPVEGSSVDPASAGAWSLREQLGYNSIVIVAQLEEGKRTRRAALEITGVRHVSDTPCFLSSSVIASDDIFRKVLTGDDIG